MRYKSPGNLTKGQQKVFDLLNKSEDNLFVSGSAGTGKTHLIHSLRNHPNTIVVAPTGIAALTCKGSTIHRTFQLPFGLLMERDLGKGYNKALAHCKLLIIDEISMVRADLLDAIDQKMRTIKKTFSPFGGVRTILVGDFYQLAPVLINSEEKAFRQHYKSPFAFDSKAWKFVNFVPVILDEVKRQNESSASVLNQIRVGDYSSISVINESPIRSSLTENMTTLTTTNAKADRVNQAFLDQIRSSAVKFETKTEGNVLADVVPKDIVLKVGARVLLTKNSEEYVNGDTGIIISLPSKDDPTIRVKVDRTESIVNVEQAVWEFFKYSNVGNKVVSTVDGRAYQYPVKLGWSITIHKSQGMTLNSFALDLSQSFAHGQIYVGLSRIVDLKNLSLTRPISKDDFILDPAVEKFYEKIRKNARYLGNQ